MRKLLYPPSFFDRRHVVRLLTIASTGGVVVEAFIEGSWRFRQIKCSIDLYHCGGLVGSGLHILAGYPGIFLPSIRQSELA